MLCCAVLCCAVLCYAMLCYAMLHVCYAMLCYAMLCYAMLCYAMLCYAMLCYAMLLMISPEKGGIILNQILRLVHSTLLSYLLLVFLEKLEELSKCSNRKNVGKVQTSSNIGSLLLTSNNFDHLSVRIFCFSLTDFRPPFLESEAWFTRDWATSQTKIGSSTNTSEKSWNGPIMWLNIGNALEHLLKHGLVGPVPVSSREVIQNKEQATWNCPF